MAAANSALRDPDRVVIEPDYASESGRSVRTIGYSQVADDLLTVIVLEDTHPEYRCAWEYGRELLERQHEGPSHLSNHREG